MSILRITFHISEEFMLVGDLTVAFHMVHHLHEVVGEAFEVDRSGCWAPPEMEVGLGLICQLDPRLAPSFIEDTSYQIAVVTRQDLKLVNPTFQGVANPRVRIHQNRARLTHQQLIDILPVNRRGHGSSGDLVAPRSTQQYLLIF